MIIAGGAVVLLAGVGFIVFSSNDEIAEVIHEVESETAKELAEDSLEVNSSETVSVDGALNSAIENQSTSMNVAQNTSVPAANRVILGEVEPGNIVTVPQAQLLKDGYVVLYKVDNRGEATLVGKTQVLGAGVHNNLKIQLSGPAVDRQAIVAVLHGDDGDEKFEYPGEDNYLLNGGVLASDIDVVGVVRSDRESRILETQVAAFLETNFMD